MSHDDERRGIKIEYLIDKKNDIEGSSPPRPQAPRRDEPRLPIITDSCSAAEIPVNGDYSSASASDKLNRNTTVKYSMHSDPDDDDTKKLRDQLSDALYGRDRSTKTMYSKCKRRRR